MKKYWLFLSLIFPLFASGQNKTVAEKVDSVLNLMTLEEKIGQMNQYNGDKKATGPISINTDKERQIKSGMVGSVLNVKTVYNTRKIQELAIQSRLKIPLLFGLDVIHGYRTIFPIPLAESCSWDLALLEKAARVAAKEAAASGTHWTFAPMVDIAKDPRWGRIMEGAGEDTWYGSRVAAARVKGFQGSGLGNTDAVMACAKHFAAYGAAQGGRDYNSVDMSERELLEVYLPPFKAAVDANVATFMNAFNTLNGIPATGSTMLQRVFLKGKWNFGGFVVSDWESIGEMIPHGFAEDKKEAALHAVNAGCDMDMQSRCYIENLAQLVKEGKVNEELINDAVRRILTKKFEMGLFEDPFRFCNQEREKNQWNNKENLGIAREVARKSIVLLKNYGGTLPISSGTNKIALIGPLVKSKFDNLGFWNISWPDDSLRIVSLWDGMVNRVGKEHMLYAKGCDIEGEDESGFEEALSVARKADIVIVSVGEKFDMSGEGKCRSNLHLPGVQEKLVMELITTGKPVIVMISAGRPLIFNAIAEHAHAILYTWWLGTEAGNAMADVLLGDYNPSGKLTVTFPRAEGQIPFNYNHLNTGRPDGEKAISGVNKIYKSNYLDIASSPLYPFGYGLSYTTFKYGELLLNTHIPKGDDSLVVSVDVTNTGKYRGEEIVQLYIRDIVASVVRPVKELRGFSKVMLNPGETKRVKFILTNDDLKFYDNNLDY
ncbi:MAG: beta-glucosidase BglX, partial [Bacteroidales bacterium]|nr:beta-glucosidase BglX [Bacteroidales bacterium]